MIVLPGRLFVAGGKENLPHFLSPPFVKVWILPTLELGWFVDGLIVGLFALSNLVCLGFSPLLGPFISISRFAL